MTPSGGMLRRILTRLLTPAPAAPIYHALREHFGQDPQALPIVSESFDPNEHPNLHLALEAYVNEDGRDAELLGISIRNDYPGISLSRLVTAGGASLFEGPAPSQGPVQYVNIPLDEEVLSCVQRGLYLVRRGQDRCAILLSGPNEFAYPRKVQLEVAAPGKEGAEGVLAELRRAMRARNVYRGRVLSFDRDETGGYRIRFHRLPAIERRQIILPPGVLERVERQTLLFSRHSAQLAAAGRHLKRGVLLHGRPGTGKTLTAMYLAGQMRERTVFLMTGMDFGWLSLACQMARTLQPSIVILEDVDLIAEDRSRPGCVSPLLFELLNHMDGLAEDTDVVFLLTTNRAEVLEPALAARPGRVDQAVELPMPDVTCRRRLFELYGQGLEMNVTDLDGFIGRTDGASAAFIRELLRKASLFAAEEHAGGIRIHDRHLEEALRELALYGGGLTQSLLGATIASPERLQ